MMLQRLATGSTGVEQARYRRSSTRGSEALARACAVYTQPVYRNFVYSVYTIVCMEGPWHLLFNVRQRMVYMISAEGFAFCLCRITSELVDDTQKSVISLQMCK